MQDAFLTFAGSGVVEWDSFRCSGMGGRGSGFLRYMRKQGLVINTAEPADFIDEGIRAVK